MRKLVLVATSAVILSVATSATTHAQVRKLWVAPKAGVWKVAGKDEVNTVWTGSMTLTKRGAGKRIVRYRGYFYWLSDNKDTEGREYFNGSCDRFTGKFRLRGYAVKNVKGELGTGIYIASVNQRGRNVRRGSWGGEDNIPGKWSAVWSKVR
jgi:hypothetical protein